VSTQPPHRRAWIEVDLANLLANARTVRAASRSGTLLPMVKANAYGLGAVPVVRALESLDPWGYGVATVEEGIELRDAGVTRPILVFTPAASDQLARYRRHDLRAVLDAPAEVARWDLPFHLEIDTGMGRCGVRWDDAAALTQFATPHLEGVFTHFYAADSDRATVALQWGRFEEALGRLPARPRLVHAANSAAAWRLDRALDLARPGIFLYGGAAAGDLPDPAPVATIRAPVVSVRRIGAGDAVSYGAEWRAERPTAIATLGIGYADGIPRAVKGKAFALLGGRRRPIVGRVTMDFVMVDMETDDLDGVRVGEVATLVGTSPEGGEAIGIDEFAGWAGTISYEILARLGNRVTRVYTGA